MSYLQTYRYLVRDAQGKFQNLTSASGLPNPSIQSWRGGGSEVGDMIVFDGIQYRVVQKGELAKGGAPGPVQIRVCERVKKFVPDQLKAMKS